MGGARLGVTDLVANWAPGALAKKPAPEEAALEKLGCLGAAGLAGAGALLANCAPTALSKKPLDVPATTLVCCYTQTLILRLTMNLPLMMLSKEPVLQENSNSRWT